MKKGTHTLKVTLICIFTGLLLISPDLSFSQRPPVPPINLSYFRIDFVQSGARSAALGSAFIGAAQDETAAPINPAGLTYLKSAGASLHQRIANLDFDEPIGAGNKAGFGSQSFDQNLGANSTGCSTERFSETQFGRAFGDRNADHICGTETAENKRENRDSQTIPSRPRLTYSTF